MPNLAIVGCGITGALTAYMVKQCLPRVQVVMLDKARGVGGRMSTSRSPINDQCTVDLGAQYFTVTQNTSQTSQRCYEELVAANLLQPLNSTIEGMRPSEQKLNHYICIKGSGSIVKYFIHKSGCQTHFSEKITEVSISTTNNSWVIKTENSIRDGFHAVILTIPVPQILQIQGISDILSGEHRSNLEQVTYNSRLALGLFYSEATHFINTIPWSIKYVSDNPVIRYMSVDNKKRNCSSELPSMVIQTTKEFGAAYIDSSIHQVQELILKNVHNLVPNFQEPSHIKFHKWRYAQVETPYLNKPGCVTFKNIPLLIGGGDGFISSSFNNCLYSAEKIVENVKNSEIFH